MKILIYAHLFPPSKGGVEYANLEIANGLYKLGHEIKVIACHNKGIKEFIKQLNFPVHLLPKWPFAHMSSLSGKGLFNWIFALWYFVVIKYCIKSFKPDVILVTDETANSFWGIWAERIKIPYISVCSVPHIDMNKVKEKIVKMRKFRLAIHQQIVNWSLNSYVNAKFMLVVSNSTKNEIIKVAPELTSKIDIVPRSVDDAFFDMPINSELINELKQKYGLTKKHFIILSVARLANGKGIDDVISSLKGLRASTLNKIKYIVVGSGKEEGYLRELATKLNLNNNVIFVGEVPHLQLISYYDMCDLFILSSHSESFGRVFVEAATRSKPAIGVRKGGMVDIIEDGTTGFLVSAGDVKAIRDKLIYLMSNIERARKLGEKARYKAENKYASKTVAIQLYRYLNEVVR